MTTDRPESAQCWQFLAHEEADTRRLGEALAAALEPGAVVALVGNLGAGKTRLAQAVAAGLGIDPAQVNSPTFVLIQEYDGRLPLYHFDTYRLRDTDEFLELGADELLHADGVCLIEWADRVADVLPGDVLRIEITPTGPHTRRFSITPTGQRSTRIAQRWRDELAPPTPADR